MRFINIVAVGAELRAAVVDLVHWFAIEEHLLFGVVNVSLRYGRLETIKARLNQPVNIYIACRKVNRVAGYPALAAIINLIALFSYSFVFRWNCFIPADFLAHFGEVIFVDKFRRVRDINYAIGVALRNAVLSRHFYILSVDGRAVIYTNTALLIADNYLADRICYIFAHFYIVYRRILQDLSLSVGGQFFIFFVVRFRFNFHRNGTLPRVIILNCYCRDIITVASFYFGKCC